MVDLTDAAIIGGIIFGSYVVQLQLARGIAKRQAKTDGIVNLFKQLGITKFKPSDLNSKNLDDMGFSRLVYLLKEAQGAPNPFEGLSGSMGKEMAALQALAAMSRTASPSAPVTPTSQSTIVPPPPASQSRNTLPPDQGKNSTGGE